MSDRSPEQIIFDYLSERGRKAALARAAKLSPQRRSAIAKKAAKASARVRKLKARNKKKES